LDEAVYNKLVSDLSERAADLVNKRLVESMADDKVSELEKIIGSDPDNQQAVQDFIAKNVPDYQAVAGAALAEFRQLYLGVAA